MLGAMRASRVLLDARNRFSKTVKLTQTQKRNKRDKLRIVVENAKIIREGEAALGVVNAKLLNSARAAASKCGDAPLEKENL